MQNWSSLGNLPVVADILLFDRFSNYCLANLLEPFRAANDLAGRHVFDWRILSLDGKAVVSSSALKVMPDSNLASQRAGSILFVLSSYGYRELDTKATRIQLRNAAQKASLVAGLDTAAWLLAGAGLLEGREATIHWDIAEAFAETFHTTTYVPTAYVINEQIITSGGASTAFDLAHYLIGQAAGETLSLDVGALLLRDTSLASQSIVQKSKSRETARALAVMQATIEEPIAIGELANRVASTQKQLERRFKAEFAASPSHIYQYLRLAAARRLLDDTHIPIAEVAVRTGYRSPAALSRAFKVQYGFPPRDVRKLSRHQG